MTVDRTSCCFAPNSWVFRQDRCRNVRAHFQRHGGRTRVLRSVICCFRCRLNGPKLKLCGSTGHFSQRPMKELVKVQWHYLAGTVGDFASRQCASKRHSGVERDVGDEWEEVRAGGKQSWIGRSRCQRSGKPEKSGDWRWMTPSYLGRAVTVGSGSSESEKSRAGEERRPELPL
jgi:hypothetical protein